MIDADQESEKQLPIRELSARTHVNTVTLRAWERRYGLLTPQRTPKGHRIYSEKDVIKVERILSFVARGVPISKVKTLFQEDIVEEIQINITEEWQDSVAELIAAVESFSLTKVEHLIHKSFVNYPVQICRDRLMNPVFDELVLKDDSGASLGFAESELIRYVLMRLSAKVTRKKSFDTVILIAGNQTPIWSLALMALELYDAKFSVNLITRALSVAGGIELAGKCKHAYVVFYQDGIWKGNDQKVATTGLLNNDRLCLFGTAAALTQLVTEGRVFRDAKGCVGGLLKLQKNH
jgi:DNA-binding transcriptional MerR regulator